MCSSPSTSVSSKLLARSICLIRCRSSFHDIFLPWEYPRHIIVDHRCFWAEQYLLQAFLALNNSYEVMFASQAVIREHPNQLTPIVPSFEPDTESARQASAFWLRRCATTESSTSGPEEDVSDGVELR